MTDPSLGLIFMSLSLSAFDCGVAEVEGANTESAVSDDISDAANGSRLKASSDFVSSRAEELASKAAAAAAIAFAVADSATGGKISAVGFDSSFFAPSPRNSSVISKVLIDCSLEVLAHSKENLDLTS
jgi:hypothetical protein